MPAQKTISTGLSNRLTSPILAKIVASLIHSSSCCRCSSSSANYSRKQRIWILSPSPKKATPTDRQAADWTSRALLNNSLSSAKSNSAKSSDVTASANNARELLMKTSEMRRSYSGKMRSRMRIVDQTGTKTGEFSQLSQLLRINWSRLPSYRSR